jgi:ribosome modulation factor
MKSAQFKEGQEAFISGRGKECNPYPIGSVNWAQWNTGWDFQSVADNGEPE